mgnify:CR=1 FL=1
MAYGKKLKIVFLSGFNLPPLLTGQQIGFSQNDDFNGQLDNA